MATRSTIKSWFIKGAKPTQAQFSQTWDSFVHRSEDVDTALDATSTNPVQNKAVSAAIDEVKNSVLPTDKEVLLVEAYNSIGEITDPKSDAVYLILGDNKLYTYDASTSTFETMDANKETIYVTDDSVMYVYNGSTFVSESSVVDGTTIVFDGTMDDLSTFLESYTKAGVYSLIHVVTNSKSKAVTKNVYSLSIEVISQSRPKGYRYCQTLSNKEGYKSRSKILNASWSDWEEVTYASEVPVVEVTSTSGDWTQTIEANTLYVLTDTPSSITIDFATCSSSNYIEYSFKFTTGDTAPTISLPTTNPNTGDTIVWPTNPEMKSNTTYEFSVVDNVGLFAAAES